METMRFVHQNYSHYCLTIRTIAIIWFNIMIEGKSHVASIKIAKVACLYFLVRNCS